MPRPCLCDRPGCSLCRLYRDSPRHRAAWDAGPAAPTVPATPAPEARPRCEHLAEEPAGGGTLRRLGLALLKTWHACGEGLGTNGYVCLCHEAAVCGSCDRYTAPE